MQKTLTGNVHHKCATFKTAKPKGSEINIPSGAVRKMYSIDALACRKHLMYTINVQNLKICKEKGE